MRLSIADLFVILLSVATLVALVSWLMPQLRPITDAQLPRLSTLTPHVVTVSQRSHVLGYNRAEFGDGWANAGACTVRESIMQAHFSGSTGPDRAGPDAPVSSGEDCTATGEAVDYYTGSTLTPNDVEIDHIFPLAAAWDLGAYAWDDDTRLRFANDPINLIATEASANREKSDQLPSEWMPSNARARCWYARRLALVAVTYQLALPVDDVAVMSRQCRMGEWLGIH